MEELDKVVREGRLIYGDECYQIMGACFEVYREKGSGFLENVYQECLEIEFGFQNIPFTSQIEIPLAYKGIRLRQSYKPDVVCFDKIILEIKAVSQLAYEHRSQVLNYLNATGYRLGLLVNFGHHPQVEWERLVL